MKSLLISSFVFLAWNLNGQSITIGTISNSIPLITNQSGARDLIQRYNPDAKEINSMRIQWSREENAFLLIANIEGDRPAVKAYTLTQNGSVLSGGNGGISEISCQSQKCIECEMSNDVCICKSGTPDCYKTRRVIL